MGVTVTFNFSVRHECFFQSKTSDGTKSLLGRDLMSLRDSIAECIFLFPKPVGPRSLHVSGHLGGQDHVERREDLERRQVANRALSFQPGKQDI